MKHLIYLSNQYNHSDWIKVTERISLRRLTQNILSMWKQLPDTQTHLRVRLDTITHTAAVYSLQSNRVVRAAVIRHTPQTVAGQSAGILGGSGHVVAPARFVIRHQKSLKTLLGVIQMLFFFSCCNAL